MNSAVRNWKVSDMTLAACKPLEGPFERTTEEWTEEWNAETRKVMATLRANEDADYRLRRDYAKVKATS